jgi:hypothetical protein
VLCGYPHPSVKTSGSGSGYQKTWPDRI